MYVFNRPRASRSTHAFARYKRDRSFVPPPLSRDLVFSHKHPLDEPDDCLVGPKPPDEPDDLTRRPAYPDDDPAYPDDDPAYPRRTPRTGDEVNDDFVNRLTSPACTLDDPPHPPYHLEVDGATR
ncbi:hypothetical protein BN946_scf184908.g1 [Trametes cinnabarina]|uniref:Uncharacterized protein n=1 Tax=Pycnoporus cinnabarinus TaxID=5643 RepID=A0A060SG79_PYCCI|nr:hypothetical protein BN946_scf184908.g1 [Trametes cinnabarina]